MLKKVISCLVVLSMIITLFAFTSNTFAAATSLSVQFNNGDSSATSNTISARYLVTNSGSSSVNLTDIKLRYYYTADSDTAQNFYCDHAGMMNGGSYTAVTSNVTGKIVKMSTTTSTADSYIEVGFSGGGTLSPGGTVEIQTRVSRSDWSNYNQSNDYSYKSSGSYINWDQITAYIGSEKVYGKEPVGGGETKDPTISPATVTFVQGSANDIYVTLTPNGNTFKGITGLTQGTNYTVSGNTVTLLKSYLNSLSAGTKTLTFDFGSSNNPKLNITVNPKDDKNLTVTIGNAAGKSGDTVTVPVSFTNVSKVGNVGTCNFYATYDTSLLEATEVTAGPIVTNAGVNFSSSINNGSISFLFLDNTIGNELIKTDGVFAYITFKIKSTTKEVETPVTFKTGGAFGDGNMSKIASVNLINGSVGINMISGPTISPTSKSFIQGTASDLKVTLSDASSFNGITGLTKGTDYTVSGSTVTILKSYLNSLTDGTKTLTFDFGTAGSATLTLTVNPVDTKNLNVTIGTAAGKSGDTVTVPVSFTNVSKVGNVGTCNFYATYDTSLLEATEVKAGPIVTNAGVNFSSSINNGSISFLFLDNTIGNELIKTDGVFAYITFKIKSTTQEVETPVAFKTGGAFGDGNMSKIATVNLIGGSVEINMISSPTISPTSKSFIQGTASDLKVTLSDASSFNGITGLTKGTDYTVSGSTVTILKSYLNSLTDGTKTLTFDFGTAGSATLTLTVNPVDTKNLNVTIGTAAGKSGDTVTVPVSFTNVSKVGNIGTCNFYVTYDTSLLEATEVKAGPIVTNAGVNFSSSINNDGSISFLFLDNTIGDELIKTDGVFAYITFKIKSTTQEVETPVAFKTGGAFGDGNMSKIATVNLIGGSVEINKVIVQDPTISPTTASFIKGTVSDDLKVELTPNGNTFKGITGLTKGTDFTVDGNTVTILKSYLNSLTKGTKALTFDFGSENNPVLTITINEVTGAINATIGSITTTAGNTIKLPISLSNVSKIGVGNVVITYDTNLLEAIDVSSGSIIPNEEDNFFFNINDNGIISIIYINATDKGLIEEDGEFANIEFKVKSDVLPGTTIPVTFKSGLFGDADWTKINTINLKDGCVVIKDNKPSIKPTSVTFDKGNPSDIAINVVYNGIILRSIEGLTKDVDYTISDNKAVITLLSSYLSTLDVGTKDITFKFDKDNNLVLKLNIIDTTSIMPSIKPTSVTFDKGNPSDIAINVVYNGIKLKAIEGLTKDVDYTISDNKAVITLLKSYLSTLPVGNKDITFNFDANKNLVLNLTVIDSTPQISSINPTSATFDKYAPEEVYVTLNSNGNTFKGITGLTQGNEYTVSGDTVKFSQSYMSTLAVGTKIFTFDFGLANNPEFTLNVVDSKPPVTIKGLGVTIGNATGKVGDTITIPVTLTNVAKMGNIGTCNFYIEYDNNVLEAQKVTAGPIVTNAGVNFASSIKSGNISILFLDNSIGDELITSDGVLANITFKVLGSSNTNITFKAGGAFGDGNFSKLTDVTYINGSVN